MTSPPAPSATVLDRIRAACATVAEHATWVRVDVERVPAYAAELAPLLSASTPAAPDKARPDDDGGDPWRLPARAATDTPTDDEARAALVLALATVNFGSGWHPIVGKRPGMSGATTMAAGLRAWADAQPLTTDRLRNLSVAEAHVVFGQPTDGGPVNELMGHFATALHDLARLVDEHHGGSFLALVGAGGGRAAGLVDLLGELAYFADVATHDGRSVPLYKRAQLAAVDLDRAFAGHGPGAFTDLDDLTAFADNLVPHVLRLDGVLRYDHRLVERIGAGELLVPGSPEEVEIRAVGVDAVERLRRELLAHGVAVRSSDLDTFLWRRGAGAGYKAVPRHRCRTVFY